MHHSSTSGVAVECTDIWKIFGKRADEALNAARNLGRNKSQISEEFDCVVGVAGASFDVMEGEIFCIMGLSGSGKSTLVRHINRLLEPTAGKICIRGEDILLKSDQQLRRIRSKKIGMVFQNNALMPHRTVRDNVALPLEIQKVSKRKRYQVAERALTMVELAGWEDKYAHELSGGMQQRVNLARAIAADPDILLMDEPFSALDPLIRRQLQDQFMELSREMKKTTIFITHDLDEAIRIGDRIAIMKDGVIVQIGTPEEIVTDPADDYVADFVAGISRLKLVYAHSVMEPIESWNLADFEDAPRVPEDSDLDHLIDVAVQHESPLIIVDAQGVEVGVIDRPHLLRGIQGNK